MQQVADASNIKIFLPDLVGGEPEGQTKIAHVYDATLNISAITEQSRKKADGKWGRSVVKSLAWTLSGTSVMVLSPGQSFKQLLRLMRLREDLFCTFEIHEEEEYSGYIKILNLSSSGNTGQNVACAFVFEGQGPFDEVE